MGVVVSSRDRRDRAELRERWKQPNIWRIMEKNLPGRQMLPGTLRRVRTTNLELLQDKLSQSESQLIKLLVSSYRKRTMCTCQPCTSYAGRSSGQVVRTPLLGNGNMDINNYIQVEADEFNSHANETRHHAPQQDQTRCAFIVKLHDGMGTTFYSGQETKRHISPLLGERRAAAEGLFFQ